MLMGLCCPKERQCLLLYLIGLSVLHTDNFSVPSGTPGRSVDDLWLVPRFDERDLKRTSQCLSDWLMHGVADFTYCSQGV